MGEQEGVTLVEVMVSVAILAILAAIAVPSYRFVINSGQVSADMNALVGTLQLARAEAIKRGLAVAVCASNTSTNVGTNGKANANPPACTGVNTWQVGWFSFVDFNNNGSFDGTDTLIAVQGPLASSNTLVADDGTSIVRFNREGFVSGLAASAVTLTLSPVSNAAVQKRCLFVGSAGRLAVLQPAPGVC